MSAAGRRQNVVACMLKSFLSTHFTEGPGEKEGCFLVRQKGRKGVRRARYDEDDHHLSTREAF